MKRISVMALMLTTLYFNCFGQVDSSGNKASNKAKILYVIKIPYKQPLITENLIIAPIEVDTLYGLPGQLGGIKEILHVSDVWILKPRPTVEFSTFNEIMNFYGISQQDRLLPTMVDNQAVDYPETIIADINEIVRVDIDDNRKTRHLNIKTKHPPINIALSKDAIIIH